MSFLTWHNVLINDDQKTILTIRFIASSMFHSLYFRSGDDVTIDWTMRLWDPAIVTQVLETRHPTRWITRSILVLLMAILTTSHVYIIWFRAFVKAIHRSFVTYWKTALSINKQYVLAPLHSDFAYEALVNGTLPQNSVSWKTVQNGDVPIWSPVNDFEH